MKKFLLTIAISATMMFAVNESQAQSGQMKPTTAVSIGGTTAGYDSLDLTNPYKCASFQVDVTRVSSAMFGQLQLQATNNHINWFNTAAGDTVHIANAATQTSTFTIAPATGVLYKAYRIKATQVAGDTCTIKSYFNGRN